MKKVIATTKAPGAIGPYSQAIDTGSFVYASAKFQSTPQPATFPKESRHRASRLCAMSKPFSPKQASLPTML